MTIIVPQIKIQVVLRELIDYVILDYNTKVTGGVEEESWLYRVFYGLKADRFDYYTQGVEIIVNRDESNSKQLEIRRDFDPERAKLPTIFINTPSETQQTINTIGMNMSTVEDTEGTDYYENDDGSVSEIYKRSFQGVYELMITSVNKDEAEFLYRFLQALFIAAADTLSFTFSGTFEWSGKQIMINSDVIQYPLNIRVLTMKIDHTIEVPRFSVNQYASDVDFEGTPIDPN